jgi:mannose/fructose-specific phosphotransferase system component IIA
MKDEEAFRLVDQGREETDQSRRKTIYKELQTVLNKELLLLAVLPGGTPCCAQGAKENRA